MGKAGNFIIAAAGIAINVFAPGIGLAGSITALSQGAIGTAALGLAQIGLGLAAFGTIAGVIAGRPGASRPEQATTQVRYPKAPRIKIVGRASAAGSIVSP